MNNQTRNQSTNAAGSGRARVAALGLVDTVLATTVEDLERTSNVLTAQSPVSKAWDSKVRNSSIPQNHREAISTWQPKGDGNQIANYETYY